MLPHMRTPFNRLGRQADPQKTSKIPVGTIRTTISREHLHDNNGTRPRELTAEHRNRLWEALTSNPKATNKDLLEAIKYAVQKRTLQRVVQELKAEKKKEQNEKQKKPVEAEPTTSISISTPTSEPASTDPTPTNDPAPTSDLKPTGNPVPVVNLTT